MKEAAETSVVQVLALIMVLILFALSGCAGQVKPVHQSRSEYFKENHQREIRNDREPKLGLALAGGGTKAADFALGVIQGLAEADIMDKVDVMSTVSGGGYAALWYYVRMLDPGDAFLPKRGEVSQREWLKPFFEDCLPYRYQEYSGDTNEGSTHLGPLPNCPTTMTNYDYPRDQFRYQNYLRGYQDLFAIGLGQIRAFSYVPTSERKWEVGLDLSLLAVGTLAAIAINAVPNVVFDWGVSLSPSLNAYEHGIARTFGANPTKCRAEIPHCLYEYPKHAWRAEGDTVWARENLTFEL